MLPLPSQRRHCERKRSNPGLENPHFFHPEFRVDIKTKTGKRRQRWGFIRYEAPETLEAAVALLAGANGAARVLAGGTDVIVQMETDLIEPELLVDIKKIPELRRITAEKGGFRVGAAVTGMELMEHAAFCKAWPGVIDGVKLIGSIQVKGRATMGGNLCNASPAADSVPRTDRGRRHGDDRRARTACARCRWRKSPPVRARLPWRRARSSTSFLFPPRPPHSGDAYQRFTPRTEMDIAVVGVGVNLTLDDSGVCTAARVALGAVAPTVLLVEEAAARADRHARSTKRRWTSWPQAASAACRPIDDKRGTKEYRIKVAGVLAQCGSRSRRSNARGRTDDQESIM